MILSRTVILSLVSAVAGSSGIDPIDNYCWKLNHQSTIKNNTLYIDGGVEVFTDENNHGQSSGQSTIGYATPLIAVDLSSTWDWKEDTPITAINKTANPKTGSDPPLVVEAALYPGSSDDNNIYLYGGTVSNVNTSFPGYQKPSSPQYALWSYDTSGDSWNQYDVTVAALNRPAGGAHAEASDQGKAFWLNGYINNGTSNSLEGWDGLLQYLDGLIVIDTETHTAKNLSTSSLEDSPRVRGALTYLPTVGSKGALVSFGGVTKPSSDTSDSNMGNYVTFNTIDILDIQSLDGSDESSTWYTQEAKGEIPDGRTDFCVVTVSAKDNSSHNIYMYGGRGASEIYDQMYVLSIPSFIWIKIYEGYSPRYGHTCHLAGNRQMLTVGGSSKGELPCDWETKGLGVFDLSDLAWGSIYHAEAAEYEVPEKIYKKIGGDGNGNASRKTPSGGFTSPEAGNLFEKSPATNNTGTNSSSSDKGISGGAIAGAVVGSVAGAALLAAIAFFLIRQRRNNNANQPEPTKTTNINTNEYDHGELADQPSYQNRNGKQVELPAQERTPTINEAGMNPVGSMQEVEAREIRAELPHTNVIFEKG